MVSVVDLWRAIDPEASMVSGSSSDLGRPVRGVERSRALAPHLPRAVDGALLLVDAGHVGTLGELVSALRDAELDPVAVVVSGRIDVRHDSIDADWPILVSQLSNGALADRASGYLVDERAWLDAALAELRLACAEAALGDPQVATPAGLIAARTRRGVAVVADGELLTLHPRTAGRALAARFAAGHARLLTAGAPRGGTARRTRDGLWLLERQVRPGATVWLFDDLPFAAVDEVAAEAAAVTLRALMRRPPEARSPEPAVATPALGQGTAGHDDRVLATMLAVARNNGRIAPAARELGVHRNTVLYRLRRGRAEHGLDPRRSADALRLLAEAPQRA